MVVSGGWPWQIDSGKTGDHSHQHRDKICSAVMDLPPGQYPVQYAAVRSNDNYHQQPSKRKDLSLG